MNTGRDSSYNQHVCSTLNQDPKMKKDTFGIYDGILMDNMWNSIPCSDLLALADAAIITKVPIQPNVNFQDQNGITDSQQYDRSKYLFDLNSPPITTEPQLISSFSPITPILTTKVYHRKVINLIEDEEKNHQNDLKQPQPIITISTELNGDFEEEEELSGDSNLKKTPQPKQIRKKHQPKPIIEQSSDTISTDLDVNEEDEELSDDSSLKKTPQPKQRRKKHRPKVVIEGQPKSAKKSTTPKPDGVGGKRKYVRKIEATEQPPMVRPIRKSCRRKITFDEERDLDAAIELMCDKAFLTNQPTLLSPITPEKISKETSSRPKPKPKPKRRINFSHDYDSNCSTSGYSNEDQENRSSKKECSLESYLSMIESFPANYKKKRSEKFQNSPTFSAVSPLWSAEEDDYNEKPKKHIGNVESFRKKRSKGTKRLRDLASFYGIASTRKSSSYYSCMEALSADFGDRIVRKKRSIRKYIVPFSSYHSYCHYKNHTGFLPSLRWYNNVYDVDSLIHQFANLGLNNRKLERDRRALVPYSTRYREKNALVLYNNNRERGGALVPYDDEDLYQLRRRKERPKVDLDDETNRVWRLLLEDINSKGIDGTDEDKTKWWEEERNVFGGRAASFIARMHLVQGDRRFSKWKGSVVDSVIGVFLTQNVSDHLSSSAFMNLAAKYPLKSKTSNDDKSVVELDLEETIISHDHDSYEEKEVVNSNELKDILSGEVSINISAEENKLVDDLVSSQKSSIIITCTSEQSGISAESETRFQEANTGDHQIFDSETISQKTVSLEKLSESNNLVTESVMIESLGEIEKVKTRKGKKIKVNWDRLRTNAQVNGKREKTPNTMDSVDYEAVRCAHVDEIADTIKDRGMNNMLAERIKEFLNRLVKEHGSIDLEWLRDVPPDKAKEYLLSFRGLGLKSVECVRLLTLHHLAFPVDTNVGRIAVRLGWVPLQPLPESLQLHLLELYPILETIQKYLWPRLCKLDQRTLYELHYQMITFGKVFCTKNKPNCNACPMRAECRHFASAFASARLALPPPEEKGLVTTVEHKTPDQTPIFKQLQLTHHYLEQNSEVENHDPVIEEPATPIVEEPATPIVEEEFDNDIEDFGEEIPMIKLNMETFSQNLQTYMENNMELAEGDMSRALVALASEAASIPTPKLKNVSQLRTEHQVYELPDSHPLLEGLDKREPDDPCSYLLAIWTPGETAESIQPPGEKCSSQESGKFCHKETCFMCNSIREANSQTVRGTLLIPCRTAMRGSFPLNGTYFQVNEVFADHDSSLNPIDVPRSWLWNLPRRTVYFGTSIPTIFRGLTTEGIQYCFWRGFVCVRGFDQKTRAPRPLMARLHFPVSKLKRSRGKTY